MKKPAKPRSKTLKETHADYRVGRRVTVRPGKSAKKTDIAIPDSVFEASRQLAQKLNLSLSEVYTAALTDYIAAHQADDVTARLNRVYETQPSALEPVLVKIQVAALASEAW